MKELFRRQKHTQGISIIEALMIASLCAIIASFVIIMINPVSSLAAAKNAERWNTVNRLANAVLSARNDKLTLPVLATGTPVEICRGGVSSDICIAHGLIDLSYLVPKYLDHLPADPDAPDGTGSGYALAIREEGVVRITALYAENGDRISSIRQDE